MFSQVKQWEREGVLAGTPVAQQQLLYLLAGMEEPFYNLSASTPSWLSSLMVCFWYHVSNAMPGESALSLFLKHAEDCVVDSAVVTLIRLYMTLRNRETPDFSRVFDPRSTTHSAIS